jgi:tetratricopeptide (TPR) repeat protein
MHPDLLNNSRFLKYYQQWQGDPSSILFAPVAEFFLMYGMVDDALRVCREGLRRHPELVSGRIVMAKIHLRRENWDEAEAELRRALGIVPENRTAREMMERIDTKRVAEGEALKNEVERPDSFDDFALDRTDDQSWQTITMADIFARQGHSDRARRIYQSILTEDPENEAARRGIESLSA